MKLQKFYEWLQLNKDSHGTIKTYFQYVNCFGKFCDYNFTQNNLDKYVIILREEGKTASTINLFLISIRAYTKFSGQELLIPKPKKVKRKGIKLYFTEKDLQDILKSYYNEKDLALRFMFYFGSRPSELRKLKKDHINFETKDIVFYNAKGNKDRVIPFLNNKLFQDLKEHCDKLINEEVFSISYKQLTKIFNDIKINMNINDHEVVEPRTMRISFAKYCLSVGMDISYLKKLMGHSDIKITELYAEPDEKMIKEFCEKIRKEK